MIYNLLTERMIETDRGAHTLPGLLAAMARVEVASFPALRPHQRPAWHMFLVQLAVLALSSPQNKQIPEDEDKWRDALRRLTKSFEGDAPWHLVVNDGESPAFLQPPDPGGLKWKSEITTPDALDMLITSKNHDLKHGIARQATPQDWIFALVSLQTMEGYSGKYNHGIARMNGGSSSRSMIGLAPARTGAGVVDPAAWWRRDVNHLLGNRSGLSGKALLWCLPWPEDEMLAIEKLDPLFIEVCRRVRLQHRSDGLCAIRETSKEARVNAKEAKGVINNPEPWASIQIADNKALTLSERDWNYKLLNQLFYSKKYAIPELARSLPEDKDGDMILIAEAFARGNSKTYGFKSRLIPVPKLVKKMMFGEEAVDLSKAQIDMIAKVDGALRDGLTLVATNGDRKKFDEIKAKKKEKEKEKYSEYIEPASTSLTAVADALFFPTLWNKLTIGTQEGRNELHAGFTTKLVKFARAEFQRAVPGIPCARIMRPRAETQGSTMFECRIAKIFREIGLKKKEAEYV